MLETSNLAKVAPNKGNKKNVTLKGCLFWTN